MTDRAGPIPRAPMSQRAPRPYNLVAELTYRCPLRCAYCSNPIAYRDVPETVDAASWGRTFREAAALGVVHVGLTGGEPGVRTDLVEIVGEAARTGLYTHLVTAGTTLGASDLEELQTAGLKSVQLSIQDTLPDAADAVAGVPVFERKLAFGKQVRALGLPLSLNVVLHRGNLGRIPEIVEMARQLDAHRLELANTQYHGWALRNRTALLPTRQQLEKAAAAVASARRAASRPEILFVLPDYFSSRPKPCMGGWARRTMVVAPDGRVFPCHGASEIAGLEFWSIKDRSLADCWAAAPGMNAYRGFAWMPEPCRSCPERERDFGGCRCQAFALTGDAAVTDPTCEFSDRHDIVLEARRAAEAHSERPAFVYRGDRLE